MDEMIRVLIETAVAWQEQGALARFRRALRRGDQLVLDHLLKNMLEQPGITLLQDISVETVLIKLLVEEQKELIAIQEGLRELAALKMADD